MVHSNFECKDIYVNDVYVGQAVKLEYSTTWYFHASDSERYSLYLLKDICNQLAELN